MSSSRGSGAGNVGGVQPIPAGSRKMVLSLKEIVNCSEAEIYAALKECNMDPNEAVNRLLSQDPFHEVKSKREKKKEGKDAIDSRSSGASSNSSRGNKFGGDRYGGRGGSTMYNSSESGPRLVKSSYKKENGSAAYASSLYSVPSMSGNSRNKGPTDLGNGGFAENEWGTDDVMPPAGIQSSSKYQSAWTVSPGQVSMADIVKRGRQQIRTSNTPKASTSYVPAPSTNVSQDILRYPDGDATQDPESVSTLVDQVPIHEEWPVIEKPAATEVTSIPEAVHSEKYLSSGVPSDSINRHSEAEEVEEMEDRSIDNSGVNDVGSDSVSTGKIEEDDSGGISLFENNLYDNIGSYQNQPLEVHSGEGSPSPSGSSVTRNLQQLSVKNDDRELPSEGCVPSVVIPDHLQVQSVDCSHLSFGSFGSAISATYPSDIMTSQPEKPNLEELHADEDISTAGPPDARSSEYYADDSLRNVSDGGLFHRAGASAGSYETSVSQPEVLKPENSEVVHGNQYPFPSPNPSYTYDDAQHFSQGSSQMQNLSHFANVMAYTNSLPSTLSPANAQSSRESDLHQYSPFPFPQSLSAKYGNSSMGASAVSLSEALKTASFTSTQPAPHTLSGSNVASGPPLPQHLPVHPYSQPTLPLGSYTNMIGYPFLHQSYPYMPSAFQQTLAGNNTYHQTLAAILPQYKNNISTSNLPPSAAIASGYGALGNNTTIPGNFPVNTPSAPSATGLSYDDVLSCQYKEASHLVSLQQGENAAMWLQGHNPNPRTMSGVPGSTYYANYQGQQNQQSGGFRQQGQQPSQNYGSLGYPNIYHSQGNLSLEQQLNSRDGSLGVGGPQGQPKQSQIWQNSY